MKRLLILCVALLLAVAGCGGSDDNGSDTGGGGGAGGGATAPAGGGEQLSLEAQDNLKYDKDQLTADAGQVTITMTNPTSLSHDVVIEGNGVKEAGEVVGNGGESVATADLKPGTYTFYCSVDGHRQAGMEGTLTVK